MTSDPSNHPQPLACKLTGKALQERKATVITRLKSALLEKEELPEGYRYRFSGDEESIDRLVSFIKTERQCCGFFTFTLRVTADHALLELTGPEGAKDFVNREIGL